VVVLVFSLFGNLTVLPETKAVAAPIGHTLKVVAADGTSYALRADGTVWGWGNNDAGKLGGSYEGHMSVPVQVLHLTDVIDIVAGQSVAFALKRDGTVWSWGAYDGSAYGAMGLGRDFKTNHLYPLQVVGLPKIKAFAAGDGHVLALTEDGQVWSWGANDAGQLGTGDTKTRIKPVPVPNLSNVQAVAAGDKFSMVIQQGGVLLTWGNNDRGQLGDLTTTNRLTPLPVPGLSGVKMAAGGASHTVVLKTDGTVLTWGNNSGGQLGRVTTSTIDAQTPTPVPDLGGVKFIAASSIDSIALKETGTVYTWGTNRFGLAGNGTANVIQATPYHVSELTDIATVAISRFHAVVSDSQGHVYSWGTSGSNQGNGVMGDGTFASKYRPVVTHGFAMMPDLAAASVGETSISLAYQGTGAAKYKLRRNETFLSDSSQTGFLTDLTYQDLGLTPDTSYVYTIQAYDAAGLFLGSKTITVKTNPSKVTASLVVAGPTTLTLQYQYHGTGSVAKYVVTRFAEPVCEGAGTTCTDLDVDTSENARYTVTAYDADDQPLGQAFISHTPSTRPQVEAGYEISVLLDADGKVWTFGKNDKGQRGVPAVQEPYKPVQIPTLSDVIDIAVGDEHVLALTADKKVWAWGSNDVGELGTGSVGWSINTPRETGLTDVVAITAAGHHSLALKSDGTVWGWGDNRHGQLGIGNKVIQHRPVKIENVPKFKSISTGGVFVAEDDLGHTLAIDENGKVWSWGYNANGELGIGHTEERAVPTPVPGLSNVKEVTAGTFMSAALDQEGNVFAWGSNAGDFGDGTLTNRLVPTVVPNWKGTKAIKASTGSLMAIREDGTVWGSGSNRYGRLADNSEVDRYEPVRMGSVVTDAVSVAVGYHHTVVLKGDGTLCAAGFNRSGQLGDGSGHSRATCTPVAGFTDPIETPPVNKAVALTGTPVNPTTIDLKFSYSGAQPTRYVLTRDGQQIPAGATHPATSTGYQDTGLMPNKTYEYTLEGRYSDGTTRSDTKTIKTPPLNFEFTAISVGPTTADLTYNAEWNVTRYAVKRVGGDPSIAEFDVPVTGSYQDLNLTPDTEYTYTICAYDGSHLLGCKEQSVTTSIALTLDADATSPTHVDLTYNDHSTSGLITKYVLVREGGAGTVEIDGAPLNGRLSEDGLLPDTTYTYTLKAYRNDREVGRATATVTTPAFTLTVTGEQIGSTQAKVDYRANGTVTRYEILRDGFMVDTTTTATTYQDAGLRPNTTYTYTVVAYGPNGELGRESVAVTTDPFVIELTAIGSTTPVNKIDLGWTANGQVARYELFKDGAPVLFINPTATSYTDTEVQRKRTYTYTVIAYDAFGNELGRDEVSASPMFTLRVIRESITSTSVQLRFQTSGGDAAPVFVVSRKEQGRETTFNPATNPFIDTGLSPHTTYQYTVEAWINGQKVASKKLTVKTP